MATVPFRLPAERNEPNLSSPKRSGVEAALKRLRSNLPLQSDIYFNGKVQAASNLEPQVLPAEHQTVFTHYPLASEDQGATAIESALDAKKKWENTPFVDRVAIFQKAAELVTERYRNDLIAATMLGQGKNIWQAEIDAAAELTDFFRLNCNYAAELLGRQPSQLAVATECGPHRRVEYSPLGGFVYAVSPFNFTALGGSLVSGPALMGNVVTEAVLAHREFAGISFIGSSDVLRPIHAKVGEGIGARRYREFPRVVGETSGKNFHLIHPSADIPSAGQKCSATSRVHIPQSRADEFLGLLKSSIGKITIGSPDKDPDAFMGPVIHGHAFTKIKSIIDKIESPDLDLFNTEIFGPVLSAYVYPDGKWSYPSN
ncbi:delta-1-pyrroline-5-carboxylate dehydrogenase 1 [Xylaria acuta]|nr:delta-1-pyrroline-5-carboxylate dehydrogenase 1 [Xylaria acuta]